MMLTLRVFLLDLLALVDEGGRRWVLLPNAIKGGVRADGTLIDPHFPMALFDTEDVNAGDWPILKGELGLQADRHGTAWRLNREEVLLPDPVQLGFQETNVAGNNALPNPQTAGDISWIPEIDAQVDPACIAQGPPIQTTKILARAPLLGGRFRTAAFARVRSPNFAAGEVRPFAFGLQVPQNADGARAVADRLLVEYEVDAPSIVVKARSFDLDPQGEERVTREIELQPRNGSSVVNMLLANVSPLQPQQHVQMAGFHFHLYYDLTINPLNSAKRPIPFIAPAAGIRSGSVTLALPATFENAFRNPIGGFEHKICTFARLAA